MRGILGGPLKGISFAFKPKGFLTELAGINIPFIVWSWHAAEIVLTVAKYVLRKRFHLLRKLGNGLTKDESSAVQSRDRVSGLLRGLSLEEASKLRTAVHVIRQTRGKCCQRRHPTQPSSIEYFTGKGLYFWTGLN